VAAAPAAPQPPVAALPPPAANSTLSTAALAAGAPRPLDSIRDLRIGASRGTGNDGWAREGLAQTTPNNGVQLRAPEPIAETNPRREVVTVSNPGAALGGQGTTTEVTTFEQAKDQIKARGAVWQRLEIVSENGEWKYSCSIPNRQNPRLRRTYEARASEPVGAIRAVLEQLDKEQ
jgi:hypothetical protein